MKTYAPKGLHGAMLRDMLAELFATPEDVSTFLKVSPRSVWRWLADDSAPYAVLAALWHETPRGRECAALDVGNEVVIQRGLAAAQGAALATESARLARLLAISDTGAANDPFLSGPVPARGVEGVQQIAQCPVGQVGPPPGPGFQSLQPFR